MLIDWLKAIGFTGFLDILIIALFIYAILIWFKYNRSVFIMTGILILGGIFLLAREFNLTLTAEVLQRFFTVILIALIVIFQEELRGLFERLAVVSLNQRPWVQRKSIVARQDMDALTSALVQMARERTGALIVLKGRDLISRHLDGGVELNGKLTKELIETIFYPGSAGHDGATIIDRDTVTRFACHLPLSRNISRLSGRGTRHAAALGLSELTDALCLVVSEEKGTIAVAQNGRIDILSDPSKLSARIQDFYSSIFPAKSGRETWGLLRKNSQEKIIALVAALVLWFVLVEGSKSSYVSITAPVTYAELPRSWKVTRIEPETVDVTLQGPRRMFYFLGNRVKLFLNLRLKEGVQTVRIKPAHVIFPKNAELEDVEPEQVSVTMQFTSPKKVS